MRHNPIFSRAADVDAVERLDRLGGIHLFVMSIVTAIFSGVGFLSQFSTPTLENFALALVFGFSVWLIVSIFWTGAWILPQFNLGASLGAVYFVTAVFGFFAVAVISYFGNQRAIAGDVSLAISHETRADERANEVGAAADYIGLLKPILADLAAQEAQARSSAAAELAGNGPTGVGGSGPMHRSLVASTSRFGEAKGLVSSTLAEGEQLLFDADALLTELRSAAQDDAQSGAQRETTLKVIDGRIVNTINQMRSLDVSGTVRAASQIIARGIPHQTGAIASSQARIAELRNAMAAYGRELASQADRLSEARPDAPRAFSLSQEEHLMANFLRMPGLSMAALFFDFVGWVVIGFRYVGYHALRRRDAIEYSTRYNSYMTLEDLMRVRAMAAHVEETRRELESLTHPPEELPNIEHMQRHDGGQ